MEIPTDIALETVTEKLKLLNYEKLFCQKKRPHWKPIHHLYFAAAQTSNPTEQFYYFANLVAWLLGLCGKTFNPPAQHDDPNTVCTNIVVELKGLGLSSVVNFPPAKLKQGYGDAVCRVLQSLVDQALNTSSFAFQKPVYPADKYSEEAQYDDGEDLIGEIQDDTAEYNAGEDEEYDVEKVKSSSSVADPWAHGSQAATATTPLKAMVMERKELHTKASERSCIHAEIDISGTGITYDTGDHVGVYASNPPELVSLALKRLGYDGKKVVKLSTKLGSKLPNSMFEGKALAIRDILSHFLDLQSPPRKDSLAAMADCAKDPKEKQRLEYLVSKVGKEEYRTYVLDDLRSLLEIMEDFPSVQPSLGVFAARIAPKLQPRFYSISSSPLVHPNRIHITCSVVEGKSPTGRDHKGVAGTWFSRCNQGVSQVAIFVRKSNFKLPKAVETPLILVGPGTGFAPFRGFLQERTAQVSMGESKHGECHLYFGCRNKSKDFIYEDEIQSFKEKSVISHLEIAFSRDQARKVYVQDKLKKNGKVIYDLLFGECDPQATLYVCGDAKAMARDVNKALHEIIQYYGSHSSGEAELMIKNLQQGGRYLRDIW